MSRVTKKIKNSRNKKRGKTYDMVSYNFLKKAFGGGDNSAESHLKVIFIYSAIKICAEVEDIRINPPSAYVKKELRKLNAMIANGEVKFSLADEKTGGENDNS